MLREIGRAAFYQCGVADNYTDDTDNDILEIPSGVTHIGDFAFYGSGYRSADSVGGVTRSAGIDVIVIGDGVEYIGKCAFRGFSSLKTVIIGGALTIGDKAFYECPELKSVTVSGELINIGNKAFYKCASLESVKLPDTLISVGDYAFSGCTALAEITLGNSLEKIGDGAFYKDVSLKYVKLPASLKSIGGEAFRGCGSLESLVLGKSVESIGAHAFYGCDALTLYVDDEVLRDGWNKSFNSTFSPIILGCEISGEGYVLSVTVGDGTFINKFTDTVLSAPCREGYEFLGWSVSESASEAEYSLLDIFAANGMKLYPVWCAAQDDA